MGEEVWQIAPSTSLSVGLWVGSPRWPDGTGKSGEIYGDLPPGIMLSWPQIAGLFCDHKCMFGFLLIVPETDPLFQLAASYESSNLPGKFNDLAATPLDEVIRLRAHDFCRAEKNH